MSDKAKALLHGVMSLSFSEDPLWTYFCSDSLASSAPVGWDFSRTLPPPQSLRFPYCLIQGDLGVPAKRPIALAQSLYFHLSIHHTILQFPAHLSIIPSSNLRSFCPYIPRAAQRDACTKNVLSCILLNEPLST